VRFAASIGVLIESGRVIAAVEPPPIDVSASGENVSGIGIADVVIGLDHFNEFHAFGHNPRGSVNTEVPGALDPSQSRASAPLKLDPAFTN
jgi:hypothetical protein